MINWTIKRRIIFGFAVTLALFALVTTTSFLLSERIKAHQSGILDDALPGTTAAGQIKYLACEIEDGRRE